MLGLNKKNVICIVVLLVVLLGSEFGFSKYATSVNSYKHTIEVLDEKKNTALALTGAATAASAAISAIPDDTGTPIAEKLADLSTYFLIVICAIFLEKYLLTTIGFLSFRILIPIGCALLIWTQISFDEQKKRVAVKLIAFALAIYVVVPGSIFISNMIEKSYKETVEMTIENAEKTIDEIDSSTNKDSDGNLLSSIVNGVKNEIKKITVKLQTVLNNLIEALAVMIVTTCLIPLFVLWVALWLVKMVTGINYDIPKPGEIVKKRKKKISLEKID